MKRITKIVALLLIILQLFAIGVSAKDKVLSIYKNSPEDGTPFNVSNMFPGDVETKLYNVRVSYTGSIKVYFTADRAVFEGEFVEVLVKEALEYDLVGELFADTEE